MAKKVNLSPTRPRSSAARTRAEASTPSEPSHPEVSVPSGLPARNGKNREAPPPPSTAASTRIDNAFKELVEAVSGHGTMFVLCTSADTGAMSIAFAKNQIGVNASLLADAICRFSEKQDGENVSLGSSVYSSLLCALAQLALHPVAARRQQISSIHQDLSRAYVNLAKARGIELDENGNPVDKPQEESPCKK